MTISKSLRGGFTPPSKIMRLRSERIKSLQTLLKELTGRDYTDEQAQEAGMAIMRFVIAKAQRQREQTKLRKNEYEQPVKEIRFSAR